MPSSPKTVATTASVADFISAVLDEHRRADCQQLVQLMQQATGEPPRMWGSSIVGFGAYLATYADGRTTPWPVIGFSPRKNDLTLYIMRGFDQQQSLLARLGQHKTGKSCLYLKRLADVDRSVLAELVNAGVQAMAARRITAGAGA